jgi:hypothetical protein
MLISNQLIGFGAGNPYRPASMIFNGVDENLERTNVTTSPAPNTTIVTFSFWLKLTETADLIILESRSDASNRSQITKNASEALTAAETSGGALQWSEVSTAADVPIDGTWHHFVLRYDSPQGTTADRILMYKDGTLLTRASGTDPTASEVHRFWTNAKVFYIGGVPSVGLNAMRLAFIDVVEGLSIAPTDFAFNNGGVWTRKPYVGSRGNYGFSIDGSTGVVGADVGLNGQHFTGINMDASNLDFADLPPYEA